MSENENEIEQPDKILKIAERILEFNRQQRGLGLKILTPDQMFRRLPIYLAQLNAGNNLRNVNGINLKMELGNYYILCTDKKKLTKNGYKSLVDTI